MIRFGHKSELAIKVKTRHDPDNIDAADQKADAVTIRQEVDRILSADPFRHSQRCKALLLHVVERTLEGRANEIKERSVGIEVFRRPPDYDTTSDPVVRVTAGEVRRRLAQYYQGRTPELEPRISLPPGAYVPEFHKTSGQAPESREPLSPDRSQARRERRSLSPIILLSGAMAVLLIALVAGISFWAGNRWSKTRPDTNLERFWAPITNSQANVLLSVGELAVLYTEDGVTRNAEQATTPGETISPESPATLRELLDRNSVAWADAVTVAKLSGSIVAQGRPIYIRRSKLTSLTDLRRGPAVLVGGFNNRWIMSLLKTQRFFYRTDSSGLMLLQDRQNPSNAAWRVDIRESVSAMKRDFGIVARFWDPTTEKPVVIASGMAAYGTMAAGELLTTPKYLDDLAKSAPQGWEKRNIEAVFSSVIVDGNVGRPTILQVHTW